MKNIKKQIIFLFVTLSMVFVLVGCGTVKISTDTIVSINGTSNTSFKIYYDDSINKIVNNDLLSRVINEFKKDLPTNIHFGEINKSRDGELNVEEVIVTTDKMKINELKEMDTDDINVEVDKSNGLFSDIYKVNITLNDSVMNVISNYINTNINDYVGLNLGSIIGNNIANVIGEIPLDLSITMPVKIVDTNANEIVSEKTIKYSYKISDLNEGNNITLSFKVPSIRNIIIISLLVILIVIILIVFIIRRRK